ncbi:Myosin heavy chain-like protein [Citrus sinensis]|uniref:Myosin heavy chain-like protein n=1 Tax=Citrus sinensis TaxID=2711 RepID=A0ACB8NG39_CITSI|nr:Myosin heavy chain-like protein [Citrus sinensis]
MAAAAHLTLLLVILFWSFTLTSQNQQHSQQHLIAELQDAKLKIAGLETMLEESIRKVNGKSNYIEERDKLVDDMTNKIHHLQSLLSKIKDDSSRAEERLNALEEEIRLLWAASRKNNFDIHNLESKALDAEDRLEEVSLQVEKMSEIVTEQWIQIQHLEQALHMAEFILIISFFADDSLIVEGSKRPKATDVCQMHILEEVASTRAPRNYQLLLYCPVTTLPKPHPLQGFIKQEMVKNKLTAALANEELVFFVPKGFIENNLVMDDTTWEQKLQALTHVLTSPTNSPPLHSQLFVSSQIPCYLNWDYPPVFCTKFRYIHWRWGLSLFLRRVSRFGLPQTSWRSKCPYQQPPPLTLAKGVEEAKWGDEEKREYVRKRLQRKRLGCHVNPLIPILVPNLLLFSLFFWDPFAANGS